MITVFQGTISFPLNSFKFGVCTFDRWESQFFLHVYLCENRASAEVARHLFSLHPVLLFQKMCLCYVSILWKCVHREGNTSYLSLFSLTSTDLRPTILCYKQVLLLRHKSNRKYTETNLNLYMWQHLIYLALLMN